MESNFTGGQFSIVFVDVRNHAHYIVNRKYFDVKFFWTAWLVRKLNARNTCAILTTMWYRVVCPKIFNVKNYRMKYFRHEIFVIYGIYTIIIVHTC